MKHIFFFFLLLVQCTIHACASDDVNRGRVAKKGSRTEQLQALRKLSTEDWKKRFAALNLVAEEFESEKPNEKNEARIWMHRPSSGSPKKQALLRSLSLKLQDAQESDEQLGSPRTANRVLDATDEHIERLSGERLSDDNKNCQRAISDPYLPRLVEK